MSGAVTGTRLIIMRFHLIRIRKDRKANDLEAVTFRLPVSEFERIKGDTGAKQAGTKVKLVDFAGTIGDANRGEVGVLEGIQPIHFCNLLVETLIAELLITHLDGAALDGVVAWHDRATIAATGIAFLHLSVLLLSSHS